MNMSRVVELLKTEKECVERAGTSTPNKACDRNCADCDLVIDDKEILQAYTLAIGCVEGNMWIPCSERLPNNSDPVLVTLKWSEEDYEVSMFEYWESTSGWGDRFNEAVIAWMPLPEPYKPEA